MTPRYYELRLQGNLPPEAIVDFERLRVIEEPTGTILHGPLPDQAALNGLLARLELLGVQVLELRRMPEPSS